MRMEQQFLLRLLLGFVIIPAAASSMASDNFERELNADHDDGYKSSLVFGDPYEFDLPSYEEEEAIDKTGRKKYDNLLNKTSLGEDQVVIRFGGVQIVNEPPAPIKPKKTKKLPAPENQPSTKPKRKRNQMRNIALPVMLILANIAILLLLGLLAYVLARSVTTNRRAAQRNWRNCDEIIGRTTSRVSFPTTIVKLRETPSGSDGDLRPKRLTFEQSSCQEESCQFMKDIKGSSHRPFHTKAKKNLLDLKASMFKPVVYDTSTLTCPTPFNSPPLSPPGPSSSSTTVDLDENRNRAQGGSSQATVLE